ncbi:hypothetical protein NTK94_004617 [Escherichia coli]|uniref:hypothetical protein n=1 Tax=Escherichia coli TaxID=562 RepID=UPI000F0A6157|nr:hypothetical protein [Escherichia coli]EKK4597847.1 hypothetical protein [Escherichia coli]MBB7987052.1 hypothetical protein [Escherichia coli]HBI7868799.1 hypothetical protein [Escherichia coli]HDX6775543.1 hypothetical protein [Escherichia coli]
MGAGLYSGENPQKIRSKFNIEESYCAIKTNGVLGFSNRMNAWRENGDSTGAISSTNAMMLMANGENEISLEIGALGWFSDKPASTEERGRFFQKAGCSLDLVRFIKQEETLLSSIKVTINQQGIPEARSDSVHPVIRKEILAEQADPGFIDPDYFDETYFPKGMKVYQFTQKVTVTGLPEWAWTRATPYTGSDEQLRKLKATYTEMATIINSGDRARLKLYNTEALKAWSATTGDSEDDILLSHFPKDNLEGGKAKILPIRWNDYAVRVMNNGRMVQLYNKSMPTYSPLTYRFTDESGEERMGYYAPVFSLIDGQFIPVT